MPIPKPLQLLPIVQTPLFVFLGPWVSGTSPLWGFLVGKGNRFSTYTMISVIILYLIDDMGTAIGMQAEEQPRKMYEGNPFLVTTWDYIISWGLADTYTGAHRIVTIWFLFWTVFAQYTGYATPYFRLFMMFSAFTKAVAGTPWWFTKPNNYTITDFLTFKPGKHTPERASDPALTMYNISQGFSQPVFTVVLGSPI